MDKEVANPFKILSAYFITAAITRPPSACRSFKGYFKTQTYIKLLFKTITQWSFNPIVVGDFY